VRKTNNRTIILQLSPAVSYPRSRTVDPHIFLSTLFWKNPPSVFYP